MSGEYPAILKKRSDSMLGLAARLLEEGEYDLAALNAEYSAQLRAKSLLYRLSGEEWRGHGLRVLLGALALEAERHGLRGVAERIVGFVRSYRRLLAELEEAHTRAVYGAFSYSREQAEKLLEASRLLAGLLDDIEVEVFGGHA